jgi:hypothetical protein
MRLKILPIVNSCTEMTGCKWGGSDIPTHSFCPIAGNTIGKVNGKHSLPAVYGSPEGGPEWVQKVGISSLIAYHKEPD